jgi:ribonuclease BN (tRNA processing enzyme)
LNQQRGANAIPVIEPGFRVESLARESAFNDALWPDFTRFPDRASPVIEIREFLPTQALKVGRYTFRPVPVCHPVVSGGFVISDGRAEIAISGDTGPTVQFWR